MKKYLVILSVMLCTVAWCEEIAVGVQADFPSDIERSAERTRLTIARQQLEDQYKKEIKQCYQNFDVTSCRIQARDRRIELNTALRQQELRFNAQERLIHAEETRRSIADRNSEATMKEAEAQRAAAISASKDRADSNAQKQIDHALQGTKRGEYEQRQREASQHKVDLEKKLRERNKEPAAPLPVPGK